MWRLVHAFSSCLYATAAFTTLCSWAENSSDAQIATARAKSSAQDKPISFEVASIRPSREGEQFDEQILPDGFVLRNGSVRGLLASIYDPEAPLRSSLLRNAPDWVRDERFDVLAKVSTEDVADWQRETTSSYKRPAFRHALEQLLVERLKLQAHTIPIEIDGYALVQKPSVHKSTLVPANKVQAGDSAMPSPDDSPHVVNLAGGIKFNDESLSEFAEFISNLSSTIIQDRTGLTKRYDFSVSDRMPVHARGQEYEDFRLPDARWDLDPLGLKLVHAKVHTTAVVIDHIERPSSN